MKHTTEQIATAAVELDELLTDMSDESVSDEQVTEDLVDFDANRREDGVTAEEIEEYEFERDNDEILVTGSVDAGAQGV